MSDLIKSDYDVIDYEAGVSDDVLGQECHSCFRLLRWRFFDRNSSYKNGYEPQCSWCKTQLKLSVAEHTARLKELNMNSAGTKRQRHADQEEFHKHLESDGYVLDAGLFLSKLLRIYPRLSVTQGNVTVNGVPVDVSLFATSGVPQPGWNGLCCKYMGYITLGPMPEFTQYSFNERDVLQRADRVGWRSVLLRFIKAGLITEEQCNQEFGRPSGLVDSALWYKKIQRYKETKNQPALQAA